MLTVLLSIVVSLFPARYRGRLFHASNFDVQRGAMYSSILQLVLPAATLWLRYPGWYADYVRAIVDQVAAKGGTNEAQAAATLGAGTYALFTYLVDPLSLFLGYFMLEGVVRLTAFVANKEVLPSFPLFLLGLGHEALDAYRKERSYGPRIVDLVKPGPSPELIVIESCRPKEWDTLLTISYQDRMYEVESTAENAPPRPYIYRLRLIPQNKLIRGICAYDPVDVLNPGEPDQT